MDTVSIRCFYRAFLYKNRGVKPFSQILRWRWGGRPVTRHACLALIVPMAYRRSTCFSRTASCKLCASGRSQPCCRFWPRRIRRLGVPCASFNALGARSWRIIIVYDYAGGFAAIQIASRQRTRRGTPLRSDSTAGSDQTRITCRTQFERSMCSVDMP